MKTCAITDVTVVDVEKGALIPNQTVLIMNNRVDKIGLQGEMPIPSDAQVVNGHGLYLIPGLVDAHVHYFDAPITGRVLIANGVLLVRDMGMPNEYILPLRDELNQGKILGPEMIATGYILDGDPPMIPQISMGIKTPEEAKMAVRKQADAGVDMIKVYSILEKDVFLAILAEADACGLKVVGHVPESIYIEDAAAAGLDSAEHWFGFEKIIARLLGEPVRLTFSGMSSQMHYFDRLDKVDPAMLEKVYQNLRESGLTVVPTVVTFKNFPSQHTLEAANILHGEYITSELFNIWRSQWSGQSNIPESIWQNWARMVAGMHRSGIPLMVGTDLMVPGIVPGFAVHDEMEIWQEAGIPAVDILRSATLIPANFMGLGDRLGSIREGKTASMILLRGNPLQDIRNAQQIEGVFLRGVYYDREALDRFLDEAKAMAQPVTY
ncbi:MAG: amidohydrolase family protein [Chloroflexota bacterium]